MSTHGSVTNPPDWRALCESTKGCLEKTGVDPKRIVGVGLTTQRATIIAVDSNGVALRPALTWLDQRQATNLPPMPSALFARRAH